MNTLVIMVVTASWSIYNYPIAMNITPIPMPSMEVCEQKRPEFEKLIREKVGTVAPAYLKERYPGDPYLGFHAKSECREM